MESVNERGRRLFLQVAGDFSVLDAYRDLVPNIDQLFTSFFYGQIYARGVLTLRERELVSVGTLAALGTAPPQLRSHIAAALRVGATREEVTEVLLHVIPYAGFPSGLNGLSALAEVLEAEA